MHSSDPVLSDLRICRKQENRSKTIFPPATLQLFQELDPSDYPQTLPVYTCANQSSSEGLLEATASHSAQTEELPENELNEIDIFLDNELNIQYL